jgi:hypothetical protein
LWRTKRLRVVHCNHVITSQYNCGVIAAKLCVNPAKYQHMPCFCMPTYYAHV